MLSAPDIHLQTLTQGPAPVLVVTGVLDGASYRALRDSVIQMALDEPAAVVIDVDGLAVCSPSAWSVFTSARRHVSIWPDVPIVLVCSRRMERGAIRAAGVARHVPVYESRAQAFASVAGAARDARRRVCAKLPRTGDSPALARIVVREWLTGWVLDALIPVATMVATVLVENVLDHTDSAPALIVESQDGSVTVAAEDHSPRLAIRREDSAGVVAPVSGLAIVAVLCRAWGCAPTPTGKTVWAVIGPENAL